MSIIVNGTTIKKLFVNGTECKEGYANGVKVFTSENVIYPGASVKNLVANSGSYSTANFSFNVSGGINTNSTTLYIPINLTNISRLVITGRLYTSGQGAHSSIALIAKATFDSNIEYIYRYPYYFTVDGRYTERKLSLNGQTINNPTIDVSSLTGNYYLVLGGYTNTYETVNATGNITKIVAE